MMTDGIIVFGTISERDAAVLAARTVFPLFLRPGARLFFPRSDENEHP